MVSETVQKTAPAKAKAPKGTKARTSFTEIAYQRIRSMILDNEMPAGFQVTEQDMAEKLDISRTPTREALLKLEAEGLIEIWPRHGMRVKHISIDDLREIYQMVTVLEASAARFAAENGVSAALLAEMRKSIEDMDAALAADDLREWAKADRTFHRLLIQAGGNRRLAETVETLNGQAHRLRMITLSIRPKPTNSNRDHEDVVEAIARGDGEAAERIHRLHREKSGTMLIDLLTRHGLTSL
jgi:DNA-binding GntR family transcriptional regulator